MTTKTMTMATICCLWLLFHHQMLLAALGLKGNYRLIWMAWRSNAIDYINEKQQQQWNDINNILTKWQHTPLHTHTLTWLQMLLRGKSLYMITSTIVPFRLASFRRFFFLFLLLGKCVNKMSLPTDHLRVWIWL